MAIEPKRLERHVVAEQSRMSSDPITRLNAGLEGRYRIESELVKLAEELER